MECLDSLSTPQYSPPTTVPSLCSLGEGGRLSPVPGTEDYSEWIEAMVHQPEAILFLATKGLSGLVTNPGEGRHRAARLAMR